MHKLGSAEFASVHHSNGESTCIVDVPRWDFNWQLVYTLENPIVLQPDDRLHMKCVYDSTEASGMTYWGDGTGDEMCLLTMFTTRLD